MSDARERDPRPDSESEAGVPAGQFSGWLDTMLGALNDGQDSDVPCGTCTACCTASQFVHIAPDETDTLAHVPDALLFPAPRMPAGHVLMGYDENGRCPMLIDGRCSIYAHRPRTCRVYDCRVFAATGLAPDDDGDTTKTMIAARSRQWRFEHPTDADRSRHDAVRRAASMITGDDAELFDAGEAPTTPTQRAVLAIRIGEVFVDADVEPEAVRLAIRRSTNASR